VRKVMDDAQRDRLVSNVVGHLQDGVTEPVLERAFEYWRNIDKAVGDRIAKGVKRERAAAAE
jgi:catalase